MSEALLEMQAVSKHFPVRAAGWLGRRAAPLRAVDGVDLTLGPSETLGLCGESGCGKTTLSRLLLLLERPSAGTIRFRGYDAQRLSRGMLREFRRAVQPVFQNPFSALNPRMRVERIVGEPLAVSSTLGSREIAREVDAALTAVGLGSGAARMLPHEFSGGQRQRIAIARALASKPRVIILDEAVSSQDISIRAQILNLLKDLQQAFGLSYLFVAHDLATVRYMSDRVAVMYRGRIVELADRETLYRQPLHPYTQALLAASGLHGDSDAGLPAALPLADEPSPLVLRPRDPDRPPVRSNAGCHVAEPRNTKSIPAVRLLASDVASNGIIAHGHAGGGLAPDASPGCSFHPRCPRADAGCRQRAPELQTVDAGRARSAEHAVACFKPGLEA